MQIRRIITGCLLIYLTGCSSVPNSKTVHSTRSELSLSCHEMALSKSLAHFSQGLLYNGTPAESTNTIAELIKSLESAPDNHDLYTGVALIALQHKQPQTAANILKQSYDKNKKSYTRCRDLANIYELTGQTHLAIKQYKKLIKLNDRPTPPYLTLATLYFDSHQPNKAFVTLDHGIKHAKEPRRIQSFLYNYSKRLLATNQIDPAIDCMNHLAEWDSDKKPQLYQLIAELYLAQKKNKSAARILKQSTKLPHPIPENFLTLAGIYIQNNPKKTLQLLKEAHHHFPEYIPITFALANAYSDAKNYPKAIQYYERMQKLAIQATPPPQKPRFTEAFYIYYADACLQNGDTQKTEKILNNCLTDHPQSHEALNFLAYEWAQKGIHLDKALNYINKALTLNPGNPAYLDTKGWIYYKKNQPQKALIEIEKAHKIIGDDPEVLKHLAEIQRSLKSTHALTE